MRRSLRSPTAGRRTLPTLRTGGELHLPLTEHTPYYDVMKRLIVAMGLLLLVVIVVYLDRDGYGDSYDGEVGLLDSVYYATVSLSTTGYGDIAPQTAQARLINVLLVTPLRVGFLIVLVGTTLEVLTERTREQFRNARWRKSVQDHTVVIGFGTKGRSAVRALLDDGYGPERIVVVDPDTRQIAEANGMGLTAVLGDATRSEVLQQAEVGRAERVLIAPKSDDTAVLVVLTVRQQNPHAQIVAAVREVENGPLLKQSGADSVVVSSEAAGRLIGLSAVSPHLGSIMEDLLVPLRGLELSERPVRPEEVDRPSRESKDLVVAVLRGGQVHRFGSDPAVKLRKGDRVVVITDHREQSSLPAV